MATLPASNTDSTSGTDRNTAGAQQDGTPTSGVAQLVAGSNVTLSPPGGVGTVTVNSTGGGGGAVTSVTAGTNMTVSPTTGTVVVSLPTFPYADVTGAPSSLPPNGSAGGDLSGSYPNPTVAKLQGKAVASTSPSLSQGLRWTAGPTWGPVSNGYVYPEDYGAVGDGVTDDSQKIQNAINACTTGQAVFFSKNYGIGTANGGPITFTTQAAESTGAAVFTAVGGQANGVLISGANNLRFNLPNLSGFSGYGVRLSDTNSNNCGTNLVNVNQIASCGIAVDFYTNGAGGKSCLDNWVKVVFIGACTTACRCYLNSNSGPINQGNDMDVNFVVNTNNWVLFGFGGGVTNTYINDNSFYCDAFDAGAIGSVKAISNPTSVQISQCKFVCRGFWGGFVAGDYWLYSPNNNCFDFCDIDFGCGSGFVGTTAQQYAMVTNPEYNYGWSSCYRLGYGGKNAAAAIACTTTSNSRSSFNSGNAVPFNRMVVTMQLSSLASGSTATFYAYHPLVLGNSRVDVVPSNAGAGGSMQGCIIESITDDSYYGGTNIANELKIVVRNVSGATSSALITCCLVIGVP